MGMLFLFIIVTIALSIILYTLRLGISPMPTSSSVRKCMLEVIPSGLKGPVYELGCGWGTLLFALARRLPNCSIKGYELSPFPFLVCWLRILMQRKKNVGVWWQDFRKISLVDAQLIVCYLYPKAMNELRTKFDNELPPDCWIISNTFALPYWKPYAVHEVKDFYRTKIYLYRNSPLYKL